MGKKSSPAPPDYEAAAEAQAKSSREVTEQQTWANRPNQYTPWGAVEWGNQSVWDPATEQWLNQWTQAVSLTPEQQASLDSQQQLQQQRSGLASGLYDRMASEFDPIMDWSQFQDYGDSPGAGDVRGEAEDAIYGKATSRLDPYWEDQMADIDTQLRNQGLVPGDEAYDRAYRNATQARTDAYGQASFDATMGGGVEGQRQFGMNMDESNYQNQIRQQQIAEEMQQRGFTLNEINAILTGQQVGMPAQPSFGTASKAESTRYLDAANSQYQADLDRFSTDQAGMQGLMSGISQAAPFFMSDRRLKKNIMRVGTTAAGLGLYLYDYIWGGSAVGVMADEVREVFPEAVVPHASGFDMVNYSRIGL